MAPMAQSAEKHALMLVTGGRPSSLKHNIQIQKHAMLVGVNEQTVQFTQLLNRCLAIIILLSAIKLCNLKNVKNVKLWYEGSNVFFG